jgi:hypothetical protein
MGNSCGFTASPCSSAFSKPVSFSSFDLAARRFRYKKNPNPTAISATPTIDTTIAAARAPVDIPDLVEFVGDDAEGELPVDVVVVDCVLEDDETEELVEEDFADVVAAAAWTRVKVIFNVA